MSVRGPFSRHTPWYACSYCYLMMIHALKQQDPSWSRRASPERVASPGCESTFFPWKKPAKGLDTKGLWLLHTLPPQHSITHPSLFPWRGMQPALRGLHSGQWPCSAPQTAAHLPGISDAHPRRCCKG